ncbi:replication protein A [Striga asiatica]|uniref:Replication protein A n=1 Tax=Striga asiatica TaxID=4170 RepID=A0A5A7P7D2_STRAF|nr:replication protein A [Striga asiatica]
MNIRGGNWDSPLEHNGTRLNACGLATYCSWLGFATTIGGCTGMNRGSPRLRASVRGGSNDGGTNHINNKGRKKKKIKINYLRQPFIILCISHNDVKPIRVPLFNLHHKTQQRITESTLWRVKLNDRSTFPAR